MNKHLTAILYGLCALGAGVPVSFAQQAGARASGLPTQETSLFAGSGVCARCHDGLLEDGVDVSPVTLWRSTMMANAAKDPVWRAKVSAEAAELPDLAGAIEEKCITCHSPMLYRQSVEDGLTWAVSDLVVSPLYLDGVSCTVCHQVQPDNFGLLESFSGGFLIGASRTIFGPYGNPMKGPMVNNANYLPREAYPGSPWVIDDAEHCATCHNLFTHYVTSNGTYPSSEAFPEQTPFYEWLNSDYPGEGTSCQGCHMPKTTTPIPISTRPLRLQPRSPFWYHEFVGGNRFVLSLLRDNLAELGLTSKPHLLDDTILRTEELLAEAVTLSAEGSVADGTLTVAVTLTNRAGHKLPTGIPLRRVWLHLRVSQGDGAVFESGGWDLEGNIAGLDVPYEPHHDVIDAEDEVQVYEGVMQDAGGNPTRTLLFAGSYAKDNRLPPKGFTSAFEHYESVKVTGVPESDGDFNAGGSGQDTVTYVVPGVSSGTYTVAVEVCYQSVTPEEHAYLAAQGTAETLLFDGLYQAADKTPAVLASSTFDVKVTGPPAL